MMKVYVCPEIELFVEYDLPVITNMDSWLKNLKCEK